MNVTQLFETNEHSVTRFVPLAAWSCLGIIAWQTLKPAVFPSPLEVLMAFPTLWTEGVAAEVLASLRVNVEALILSVIVGLPIAYVSRHPFFKPLADFPAQLRFAGSSVFYLPLIMLLPSAHMVKVGLIMLGELFYLVTSMASTVRAIPQYRYDDARTLKMSEWRSVWYVNIRGTVGEAIDAIRHNAGVGWGMLMFVEGIVRSEGGVGVISLNAEKHVNYDEFFAVVVIIILVGIVQDWLLGELKKAVCPYV